jgi:hypothetical protein
MTLEASVVSFDQLDEHTASGARMQECHPVTAGTGARNAVDQLDTLGLQTREIGFEIVGPIRDVVQRGAAPVQEPPYGGLRAEWLEQLDLSHEGDTHALGFEGLGRGAGFPGKKLEESTALFDGMDGDRQMIDSAVRLQNGIHRRMLHSVQIGDKER